MLKGTSGVPNLGAVKEAEREASRRHWLHRADLSVLVHPETGRQRADHTSHALWMGSPLPLKAEILPE